LPTTGTIAIFRIGSIDQLDATCTNPGDTANASFVTDPEIGLALQLRGTGTAVAGGTASFGALQFRTVEVFFKGDCTESEVPSSFIVRIRFIKPGTTTVLDHGYDCAKNTVGVSANGLIHMFINTHSLCDCDDMIPQGSQLLSVSLNLTCADTNSSIIHKDLVHALIVNGHPIFFDMHAASASCAFEK
jgi:hypothetical protein